MDARPRATTAAPISPPRPSPGFPNSTPESRMPRSTGGPSAWASWRAPSCDTPFDVVVEDINKVPLFLPTLTRLPFVAIVPHLFGTTAFAEASAPMATVVWGAELPIPWVYKNAGFHAISESTRDDLVRRGVPAEQVVVIHPGVDSQASRLDPARPRAARS